MCEAAVRLIEKANYANAGTVEFIVDDDNNFYFIEVNARIQVEHPVSELVTGVDLIQAQIRVASGEELWLTQGGIPQVGHAMECRINAEDPDKNFQPSAGRIESMYAPGGPGVRFESHAHAGYTVPPYYDSMIAKLVVHQPSREQAIRCMERALAELRITGIKSTVPFHQKLLSDATFVEGRMDTTYVERNLLD